MPSPDTQKSAIEREIKISEWVEKNRNLLLAVALICIASIGAIGGLTVGRWLGAAEESARSANELWRMKDTLDLAVKNLGTTATKVDLVTDKVDDAVETAADASAAAKSAAKTAVEVVEKADAASAKASTAATAAKRAASTAAAASQPDKSPTVSITRAVRDANNQLPRGRE